MNRQERIEYLQDLLVSEPHDVFSNYALGLEYTADENYPEAEIQFKKVIELDRNYIASYFQLGKLMEKQNLKKAALDAFGKGLQLATSLKDQKAKNEFEEAIFLLED